ncbi:LacI family DNA-binding transcriptional regulator [Paenibacillus aurantiacus]|uniref:LacI family DNA-binding transcriptional regulator n=1 Tax=Paenibacillus aurantiacus TaxID=1936118 RepID=A0ABV5KHM0_9BACL
MSDIPTIRDVARRADVSVATVSRILNGLSGYSDKTKQKVLAAIEEMGYRPNAIARSLNNRRTHTIGVLFPALNSEFSSALLHGIEDYAHRRQYSVLVCNTDVDGRRTMNYLKVLREKQVDGLIFVSEVLTDAYRTELAAMNIPVVLVASSDDDPRYPHVKVDDRQAAYDATSYLIGKGHRRIAMISGTADDPIASRPRIEGYEQALLDHGVAALPEWIAYGDFFYESGTLAMEALLKRGLDLTAVFAASDEMAAGAMHAAARAGLRVPEDLSIIGYDDIRLAMMVHPPLTTVHQPLREMGQEAAAKLLLMAESAQTARSLIVPHRIMERQTVRDINEINST